MPLKISKPIGTQINEDYAEYRCEEGVLTYQLRDDLDIRYLVELGFNYFYGSPVATRGDIVYSTSSKIFFHITGDYTKVMQGIPDLIQKYAVKPICVLEGGDNVIKMLPK